MPKYCVTLERTVRTVKWIEAENDKEAIRLAEKVHHQMKNSDYEEGESDSEYDYSLISDDDRVLVWFD